MENQNIINLHFCKDCEWLNARYINSGIHTSCWLCSVPKAVKIDDINYISGNKNVLDYTTRKCSDKNIFGNCPDYKEKEKIEIFEFIKNKLRSIHKKFFSYNDSKRC
jgi:hypothetical protein